MTPVIPLVVLCELGGCTALRASDELCPPGSGPLSGSGSVQILAEGENHPVSLQVIGGTLFWLDQGQSSMASDEGSVVTRDLCSGLEKTLVRGQSRPTALVVIDTFAFWLNAGQTNGSGELKRADS